MGVFFYTETSFIKKNLFQDVNSIVFKIFSQYIEDVLENDWDDSFNL